MEEFYRIDLFNWEKAPDEEVCRLGDFLEQFARLPVQTLRRRAWLSRFW